MFALFGDDLMGIHSSKDILDDVGLIGDESELVFDLIEQNGTEFIDVHLHENFDERLIIMWFDSLREKDGI